MLLIIMFTLTAHAYDNSYKSPDELESIKFKSNAAIEQAEYDSKRDMDQFKRKVQFDRDIEQIKRDYRK